MLYQMQRDNKEASTSFKEHVLLSSRVSSRGNQMNVEPVSFVSRPVCCCSFSTCSEHFSFKSSRHKVYRSFRTRRMDCALKAGPFFIFQQISSHIRYLQKLQVIILHDQNFQYFSLITLLRMLQFLAIILTHNDAVLLFYFVYVTRGATNELLCFECLLNVLCIKMCLMYKIKKVTMIIFFYIILLLPFFFNLYYKCIHNNFNNNFQLMVSKDCNCSVLCKLSLN